MNQISLLIALSRANDDDIEIEGEDSDYNVPYKFLKSKLQQYGDLSYDSFLAAYDDLGVNLRQTFEEKFRVYKRECFTQGVCKKRKGVQRSIERTANQWDLDEVCPDSVQDRVKTKKLLLFSTDSL